MMPTWHRASQVWIERSILAPLLTKGIQTVAPRTAHSVQVVAPLLIHCIGAVPCKRPKHKENDRSS